MASKPARLCVVPLAVSLFLLAGGACVGYGNIGTVTRTIDRGNAQRLAASLAIGDGQIDLGGGAAALMRARFTTNDKRTPTVDYSVSDGTGALHVTQPSKPSGPSIGPITNRWVVNLNDDVPVDLSIMSQSAQSSLDLDTLTVTSVNLTQTSGAANVSLGGVQESLGSVSLHSTSGSLRLVMRGDYSSPTTVDIDSSSGSVTADLSGKWSSTLGGTIKTGSGSITITVPNEIAVKVVVKSGSGYIDATGFTSIGQGVYVHSPAVLPAKMALDVQSSTGNITIRTGN